MEASPARDSAPPGGLAAYAEQLNSVGDFAAVVASLADGHSGTLGGVWGSSCALVTAAVAQHAPTCLLVVAPRPAMIDSLVDDLSLFSEQPVAVLPALENLDPEQPVSDGIEGDRLRLLKALAAGTAPDVIVTCIQALMQPVPSHDNLSAATQWLEVGQSLDREQLSKSLVERGCHATSAVELPGEFAIRGGLLDLFPPDARHPVRIEWFGDEIESLRRFDVATQRSLETLQRVDVTFLPKDQATRSRATGYLPEGTWALLIEPNDLQEEGRFYHERQDVAERLHSIRATMADVCQFPSIAASALPASSYDTTGHLGFESVERFSGQLAKVRDELTSVAEDHQVKLVCATDAEIERLKELFADSKLTETGQLEYVQGRLNEGFRFVDAKTLFLGASELFQRHDVGRTTRRYQSRAIDSFLELRKGDLIVHVAHGIGRYRGLKLLEKDGRAEEHLELEYDGGTRIYVPSFRIELVQKYVGGKKVRPPLAKIGGKSWQRQKRAAEQAVHDLAAEMLELAARRDARPGIRFPDDTPWQGEFDASFPYQETPDQSQAITDIKVDMTGTKPMDRLLCGDVGFGKTEVAMRAAFKAIDAGYQVAVLVPTTVLAEQHARSFRERMAEFPFEIGCLSRFGTAKQQRLLIEQAKEGTIDILIGTHRLASADVHFANLGLLIIDEEQRFGVEIKERLKALRSVVDVLTLTATPIPRTLHMALLGVRSISNLETPPADRLAVETRVTRFNEELIRHALLRELNRGGQAYFVHNRVRDIQKVAHRLQQIVPEARIAIGHGQMREGELEAVMTQFVRHECDILLATTIIESGLDIPNANTMFIDDADRYGLADLHQLRGRVGRYKHRAYCYLLVDENKHLSNDAARRLRAIEEFSHMGAGFSLAMRDLELRGAGNLLGTQQSGHIAMVGYEMYCQLLERAVRQLKQLPPPESVEVTVDLPGKAYIPTSYVSDMRTKIDLYRRLAKLISLEQIEEFSGELVDRFGPLPAVLISLLERAKLRVWAHEWGITAIHREERYAVFTFTNPRKIATLGERSNGRLRIADQHTAYLVLADPDETGDELVDDVKSLLRPVELVA